jgi:hypothetical protein
MAIGDPIAGINGDNVPLRQGEIVCMSGYDKRVARALSGPVANAVVGVVLSGHVNPGGVVLMTVVGVVKLLLDGTCPCPVPGDALYVSAIRPGRASALPVAGSPTVAVAIDVSAFARDASVIGVLALSRSAAGASPAPGANIPDANTTITVGAGSYYTMPVATAPRVVTLGATGDPITGEAIIVDVTRGDPQPVTFRDDVGAFLFTVPPAVRMTVTAAFTGAHFAGARAVRIQ